MELSKLVRVPLVISVKLLSVTSQLIMSVKLPISSLTIAETALTRFVSHFSFFLKNFSYFFSSATPLPVISPLGLAQPPPRLVQFQRTSVTFPHVILDQVTVFTDILVAFKTTQSKPLYASPLHVALFLSVPPPLVFAQHVLPALVVQLAHQLLLLLKTQPILLLQTQQALQVKSFRSKVFSFTFSYSLSQFRNSRSN